MKNIPLDPLVHGFENKPVHFERDPLENSNKSRKSYTRCYKIKKKIASGEIYWFLLDVFKTGRKIIKTGRPGESSQNRESPC